MLAVKVFAEDVARRIKDYLPPEYQSADYKIREQNKTNGVLQVGIQVDIPGRHTAPIIYMEPFYDEAREGREIGKIMDTIAETIQQAMDDPVLDDDFHLEDFEMVKEYLAVMAVNTAENRKVLENVPHKDIADLSVLCYVDLPTEVTGHTATVKVNNEILEQWGVSREEVFQNAANNTKSANQPTLQSMEDVMEEILAGSETPENLLLRNKESCEMQGMMFILSNAKRNFGAAMMFEPEVMDKISQAFPEGFYILPSSLHEVLIVPDRGKISPKELGEMVRTVNETEVERTEQLSDRVYAYDKEKQQIYQVPESIERGKEMSR